MTEKKRTYEAVLQAIDSLLAEPCDWTAAMATVACELHTAFDTFHWTGFYRTIAPEHLQVGPYQGSHGCIDIPFTRGVCGAAAATKMTQLVDDVSLFPGHIACSSSTVSEIVVPVLTRDQVVIAVLDVDSNVPAAFDATDQVYLEIICTKLGLMYGEEAKRAIRN